MPQNVIIGSLVVLAIIYIVPFVLYAALSKPFGLKPPGIASRLRFLLSVLLEKAGVALAFTVIYAFAQSFFSERWWLYAIAWWILFACGEIAQVMRSGYSVKEATVGIVSEAIYLPAAVLALRQTL